MRNLTIVLCLFCALITPVSASTSHTVLRFVTWKPDSPKVWDTAIARFEAAYPSITIEREIAPHSSTAYHDLLTQKLKNRDATMDVFFMDVIWPAEFAMAGWALPIDDRFSIPEQEKFLPATIQASTYRHRIYGVPSRIDSGVLYYRKDLLQKYGFAPPRTWESLIVQAQTILKGEQPAHPELRGYSGQFKQYEGLICNMLEFIASHNGSFLSEDSTRSVIASPNAIQALTFVREHIIQHSATPASLTYQEPESLAIFRAREMLCFIETGHMLGKWLTIPVTLKSWEMSASQCSPIFKMA